MIVRLVASVLVGAVVVAAAGVVVRGSGQTQAAAAGAAAGPHVEITSFRDKSISYPVWITSGSDGALWFTNGDSIGRITTRGVVTVYRHKSIDDPQGITVGRDGALWFTNSKSIGRLRIVSSG